VLNNTVDQQGDQITANSQSIQQQAAQIAGKADASALNATNATVTQQGQQITAVAQDVSLLGAHNADKTAFVLNQDTVQVDGGQTFAQMLSGLRASDSANSAAISSETTARTNADTALGQRIDSVQATAGSLTAALNAEQVARANGDSANADYITTVSVKSDSNSKNWCLNPNGTGGITGWVNNGFTNASTGQWTNGDLFVVKGGRSNNDWSTFYYDVTPSGLTQNQSWCFSAIIDWQGLSAGGGIFLEMSAMDASNNRLATVQGPIYTDAYGAAYDRTKNFAAFVNNLPANTLYLECRLVVYGTVTQATMRAVKIENNPSPTAFTIDGMVIANASATQQLSASVNTLTGKVNASYTLQLNANGYVTGWKFNNDGTTGTFDVVADRFSIITPDGRKALQYVNGQLTISSADSGQRLVITPSLISVYDANGTLRVRMGIW